MFGRKMKRMALAASAATAMVCSPAHATSISIGVAANVYATLQKITAAYTLANPGNTFTVSWNSTANLKAAIIAGGNSGPYNLFLTTNTVALNYIKGACYTF